HMVAGPEHEDPEMHLTFGHVVPPCDVEGIFPGCREGQRGAARNPTEIGIGAPGFATTL
ncbi:MAG: hypothetical protein JWR00_2043, partial [Rubritepida sp.]|nr:hypothetical protein [Rubritepida sp.]